VVIVPGKDAELTQRCYGRDDDCRRENLIECGAFLSPETAKAFVQLIEK